MEALTKKFFGRYKEPLTAIPNLVEMQKRSYELLVAEGLAELFKEFSPISDYSKKKFDLEFAGFELSAPRFDEILGDKGLSRYKSIIPTFIPCSFNLSETATE